MSRSLTYEQLADLVAKAFVDTGNLADALRVADVYRLHAARSKHVESFRLVALAAKYFGIDVRRVLRGDRHRAACDARWVVAKILRERGWSTLHIAPVVGLRNHTTILHALREVNERADLLAAAASIAEKGAESS